MKGNNVKVSKVAMNAQQTVTSVSTVTPESTVTTISTVPTEISSIQTSNIAGYDPEWKTRVEKDSQLYYTISYPKKVRRDLYLNEKYVVQERTNLELALAKAKEANYLPLNSSLTRGAKRIGPHSLSILSILTGMVLGDGTVMKAGKLGYVIRWSQGSIHEAYFLWMYRLLLELGYVKHEAPKKKTRITQTRILSNGNEFKGGEEHSFVLDTFSFDTLAWMREAYYITGEDKVIKKIPDNIDQYLTPQALAIWYMDDGSNEARPTKAGGYLLHTESFSEKDIMRLIEILKALYGLECSIRDRITRGTRVGQYQIYISKSSRQQFRELIGPYMCPSMGYKLFEIDPTNMDSKLGRN